jgi:aspartate-semialdehyde dehydrogenase
MKIAIAGATGLVGRKMLQVLEERKLTDHSLILAASMQSVGKKIQVAGKEHAVVSMEEALAEKPDIALFSAGTETSQNWARRFAAQGTFVIDNSSAWRLDDNVPLVVPEINAAGIHPGHRLIANPNCSTIQLVMAMAPLHKKFHVRRMVISTYQSVTGSGQKGMDQLDSERCDLPVIPFYPHQIDMNLIPHGGSFNADGYTTEEQKLVDETRKILGDQDIQITATVVRVPVYGGHSESVNVEFHNDFRIAEITGLLGSMPGVTVQDDPEKAIYPMPLQAEGKDDVFVGRIRRDHSAPNALNLWIVSDNLRKGAATNAVQIAEYLIKNNFIKKQPMVKFNNSNKL